MLNNDIPEIIRQTNLKVYYFQDFVRLKSRCLCKSIQHNVSYKDAGVIAPAHKVSSIFTNTLDSGIHSDNDLKRNRTMHEKLSKSKKSKGKLKNNILSFRSNPKKYGDFDHYEYHVNNIPNIRRREISSTLFNKFKKDHTQKSPCEEGPCRKAYNASRLFHCICDRRIDAKCTTVDKKQKNQKRKSKNTCLCYATGDFNGDVIEDILLEYPKSGSYDRKLEQFSPILAVNNKNPNKCKKGLCAQALKQKNGIFLCKCNKRKAESEPTECKDSTCKMTQKSSTTIVKLKDKIICICNKYSQKFKQLNPHQFHKSSFNQDTCIEGLCKDALVNKTHNFVCKCTKKSEMNECSDDTCNISKRNHSLKSRKLQTLGRETKNQETYPENDVRSNKKNQLIHYCHYLKAKFHKNTPDKEKHKSEAYDPKDIHNVLKNPVLSKKKSRSENDQTGEPFFNIEVNPIDMRTLNPDEVRDKVISLGKLNKIKTCICPSHKTKKRRFLQKTACAVGVCRKAFKNKKINFTCTCAGGKARICSDTTCDAGVQMAQMSSWPTKQSKPILEMKFDSQNMNIINTKEIRNKMHAIKQSGKSELCPSGTCREAVAHNTRYICKCFHRRHPVEINECSDDICRQTNLIQTKNYEKHDVLNNNYNPEYSEKNSITVTLHNGNKKNLKNHNKLGTTENNDTIFADTKNYNVGKINKTKKKQQRDAKSKISCICAQILTKSDNWSPQQFKRKKKKKINVIRNHNGHTNKETHKIARTKSEILIEKQGLSIKFQGKNAQSGKYSDESDNLRSKIHKNITSNRDHKHDNSIKKSVKENNKELTYIKEDVEVQNKYSDHKIQRIRRYNIEHKEDIDNSCDCCICDVVKSDCRYIKSSRLLKCAEILCRSCSNLFHRNDHQKVRYRRRQPIVKKNKNKINGSPPLKDKHSFTENCFCCLCGQKSTDCTCVRSSRILKCKHMLCRSFSHFIRRHRQSMTYPITGITAKRTHVHKRKSVSIPIEKLLHETKIHNKKHGNAKINRKLNPVTDMIGSKDQRNADHVIHFTTQHKYGGKNKTISFPKQNTEIVKGHKSKLNKMHRQGINTQRDKGERICTCSLICECKLLKNKDQILKSNHHRKRKSVNKRQQMKNKIRSHSRKQKKNKKMGLKRRKVSLADEKKFQKGVAKKEKVHSKKRLKQLKLEKKQLEAISKGREEVEETSCLADFFLSLLKLGICIMKGFFIGLFKFITNPKGSLRYAKQRLKDPQGTYERIKKAYLEFWGLKKLQMLKSVTGSEKMTILSDTLQDSPVFQAFANKGKTKKEKRIIEQKNKRRRRRIMKRDNEALHGCRHMLLHTLRKTPCLWVYHVCPQFYPQCLSCLAFWHNFSNLLLFLLAFIVWTPCIACFEGFRALTCCLLCTT